MCVPKMSEGPASQQAHAGGMRALAGAENGETGCGLDYLIQLASEHAIAAPKCSGSCNHHTYTFMYTQATESWMAVNQTPMRSGLAALVPATIQYATTAIQLRYAATALPARHAG